MRTRVLLAALALAASGCAGDLPPRSLLQDLRVLALLAQPLEAGPSDTVTVRAATYGPGGAPVSGSWTFCPFTLGPTAGDVCAVPGCETPLTPAPDGSVSADVGALALACAQRYGGGSGAGVPAQVPDRLDTVFTYVASAPGLDPRTAVLRIPFYPRGAPSSRNLPPVVTSLTIGGQPMSLATPPDPGGAVGPAVPKGGQLQLHVTLDPASVQQYQDSSGRTVSEQLFVSFYATDGRFDYDRGIGLDEQVNLKDDKVANRAAPVAVYVVAHDDRGGATVLGPYQVSWTP